jgi:diguanylate cyclase (GGDEF)-like protein/PAS domain S-box-containing protein
MLAAQVPPNDAERVAALRRFGILNTAPEETFDRIAFVAKTVLAAPAAAVTFIDADRQFFKARLGTPFTQTPRDVAFCAHTILSSEPFVVLDATRDERFHDNPLVTCPAGVRFYAGAPIRTRDGFNIGVVCAIDFHPHQNPPSQTQLDSLTKLAAMAADELELRNALAELGEALERRTAAEQARAMSEQRLKDFLDTAMDWLWETDANHRFTLMLAGNRVPVGTPPSVGATRLEHAGGDAADPHWAAHLDDLAAHRPFRLFRYTVPDGVGGRLHVSVSGNPVFDSDGGFCGYRGTGRNVTALAKAEAALRDLGNRLSILSASGAIGMMVCRHDRLVEANDELLRIVGYGQADLDAGLSWSDLRPAGEASGIARPSPTEAVRADDRPKFIDTELLHKDGRWVPVSINWVFLDESERLWMALVKDIGDRKAVEAHIRDLAFHDSLTGLSNRRSLIDELARRIASPDPRDNSGALLMIDLDYFKTVNDNLGHDAGDDLLQRTSSKLQSVVRQNDMVARLGGDEFVVVLFGLTDGAEVAATAEQIVEACRSASRELGAPLHTSASVGVAMFPVDGTDPKGLLKSADLALYEAKARGRCSVRFFARAPAALAVP